MAEAAQKPSVYMAKPFRVYIAGPMTGKENHNFPEFRRAARALREAGYEVVSPVEINGEHEDKPSEPWAKCMRRDIAALMTCDGVALLPDWETSRGALLEHYVATTVGIWCKPIEGFL